MRMSVMPCDTRSPYLGDALGGGSGGVKPRTVDLKNGLQRKQDANSSSTSRGGVSLIPGCEMKCRYRE